MTEETTTEETTTETTETPAPSEPEAPASEPSLSGDRPPVDPALSDPSTHKTPAKKEYDFDKRLYKEDGAFNEEGATDFFKELGEKNNNYEKRITDMRRMVSTKGDFVKDKEEYFQDFAPQEKFMKYFEEDTPEETKEVMGKMQEGLADTFHSLALNKAQALGVSNKMLEVMEEMGILDTRTKDQQYIDKQKWVDKQKESLGSNADNIIRESKEYLLNSPSFDAATKNKMLDMIDDLGAPFVDVIHQLKNAFGGSTGGVPQSITNLAGLPPDAELWVEYCKADTTDLRKSQIMQQRHSANRPGKLSDAGNI